MADTILDHEQKETLRHFFERESSTIVQKWLQTTKFIKRDPFYDDIISNAENTIRLLNLYIGRSNKQQVQALTQKIVAERIEAEVDLSELIQNINTGQQIIYNQMAKADFPAPLITGGMMAVNRFFDTYLHYLVTQYTEMNDRIIKKKTQFINEMHGDRLSILGQIAASFAHEFRNPLTSIKGFISLLEKRLPDDQEAGYYFSIISQEMDSLEKKVSQFLYLSKMKGLGDDMTSFNLSSLVKEMINFMYPRFVVEAIDVDKDLDKLLFIKGVKEQIKQVLLNILNNAVEELSEKEDERKIYIKTEKPSENHMLVSILNNGRKIPDHILESIFEPFISTKDLGTGLGLAVCKQIIEKHDGSIWVTSEEGETVFNIKLPIEKQD